VAVLRYRPLLALLRESSASASSSTCSFSLRAVLVIAASEKPGIRQSRITSPQLAATSRTSGLSVPIVRNAPAPLKPRRLDSRSRTAGCLQRDSLQGASCAIGPRCVRTVDAREPGPAGATKQRPDQCKMEHEAGVSSAVSFTLPVSSRPIHRGRRPAHRVRHNAPPADIPKCAVRSAWHDCRQGRSR